VGCLHTYAIGYATCNSEPADGSAAVLLLGWSSYRMRPSLHNDCSLTRF